MKNKNQIKVEQFHIKIINRLNVKNICYKETSLYKNKLIKKSLWKINKLEIWIWNNLYKINNYLLY
jgi:hypothetical protein